jgi:hypothetical protein
LLGTIKSGEVEVLDVIPAIHSTLVAPPIEILFIHLDVYCRERNTEIVGLYYANNLFTNNRLIFFLFLFLFLELFSKYFFLNSLDEQWIRIASDKLQNPIVLQLENSKLSLNAVSPCIRAYCQERF